MAQTGPNYPYNKDTNPTGYKPGSIEEKKANKKKPTPAPTEQPSAQSNFNYNSGNPQMNTNADIGLNTATVPVDEFGNEIGGQVYVVRSDGQKVLTTIGELYNKATQDIKFLGSVRKDMAKYQQVAADASPTTVLAAYLKSLQRASAMKTDVVSAWKDARDSGFTVGGETMPSTTISNKAALGTQISTEFQTMFADPVPEDIKVAYAKEINDLQISRATKSKTINGKKISVSSAVTEQEQKDILNKYLKQYAAQKITLANSGNAAAMASLQKGNFGLTYTTLKNAYDQNGIPVNLQSLAKDTIEASLNPERQKSILNLINMQAKTYFPALADKIDAGYTVRQLLSPYLQTRANILEEDAETIDLKQLQGVAKDPKGLMGLYDYEVSLRKDPKWKSTKNALDTMSSLARDMTKMFGLGA
jgi:hypothetical protein